MSAELDRVNELLKGIGEKPVGGGSASSGKPAEPSAPETPDDFSEKSYAEQGSRGAAIGLAGYAAAPAYYAERGVRTMFPDFRINPFGWRDRYKAERDLVESTPAGIAGEVGGVVAPAFIPGVGWVASGLRAAMGAEDLARIAELARITEAGSRMSRVGGAVSRGLEALSPAERAAIVGGYSGIMSRPATSGQELAEQGLGGAALGAIGAKIAPKIAEKITPYFRRARTPEAPPGLAGVAGKGFESDIPFGTVGGATRFPRDAAERAAEARGEPFAPQPAEEPTSPARGPRVRNIVPRFVRGTEGEPSTFVPETPSGRTPQTTPAARAARQEAADTKQMTAGAKAGAGRMSPSEALASGIQQQVIRQFGGGGLERDIARKVQQEFPPARRAAQAQQARQPPPPPPTPRPQTIPGGFEPSASLEANQERLRDLLKNFPGLKIKPGSTRRISPNLEVLRPPRIDPSSAGFGSAESQAERQAFRESQTSARRHRENAGYTLGHAIGHAIPGGGWMWGNALGHLLANILSKENWRERLNKLGKLMQRGTRGALATPQRAGAIAAGTTAATPDLGLGADFDLNDFISQLDEARQQ